ncbi:MAG: PEGA domain-containing protein [Candidatus Zixiibacteriota bacterium]
MFSEKKRHEGALLPYCEICKYQAIDKSIKICPNCGASYDKKAKSPVDEDDKFSSHIDLEVNEEDSIAIDEDCQTSENDSIQLCDPGDLLAARDQAKPEFLEKSNDKRKTGKLTDEEVKNIRSNLFQEKDDYVSPTSANSILNSLNNSPENAQKSIPVSDMQRDISIENIRKNNVAKPYPDSVLRQSFLIRKTAYFHRNFIQLTGNYFPSSGEELIISDQHFLLKPKKIKSQYAIAAFATVLVVLLIIIGSRFISPTTPGHGSIIGVILDENNQPYIGGTEIMLPEEGKKVLSDAQGFFSFDKIPTGVFTIKYKEPDGSLISEKISIAAGEISTLSLGGSEAYASVDVSSQSREASSKTSLPGQSNKNQTKPISPSTEKSAETNKSDKEYSSLKLRANVENARLTMNGQVLGSGNLTYKKLRVGKHTAEISKNGYISWKGTVVLKSGETYVLEANLEKIVLTQTESAAESPSQKSAAEFYEMGSTDLASGDILSAIKNLSDAINLKPSMADAYKLRADAYLSNNQTAKAENDYVRAGEIYSSQNRESTAVNMFEKALNINNNSISALLNMASCYKNQNENDEAFRIYKQVLREDKNNFTANLEMGKLYFSIGKNRDADKSLRKAKDLSPRSAEVYHYLMLNYFARDDFQRVKESYGDFKNNVSENEITAFKNNSSFDAIHRIVGEYVRP